LLIVELGVDDFWGFSIDCVSAMHSLRIDEFEPIIWVLCGLFTDLGTVFLFDEFGFVGEVFGHVPDYGFAVFSVLVRLLELSSWDPLF